MSAQDARLKLRSLGSPEVAASTARFFRTGPGEYAEGEKFIGVRVPVLRAVARQFRALSLQDIESLLSSVIHEERHLALLILVLQVSACDESRRKILYDFYLNHTRLISNWDLVDCSAPHVVGSFLLYRSRKPLFRLARSKSLWERRISIVSTQHFIRHNDVSDTFLISRSLLGDSEDLIHKATGWMLREAGHRAPDLLLSFLDSHATEMPRTMLQYAMERLPAELRLRYRK
jgi:3-methyladenine DNA glycosylase AlkD